MVGWFKFHRQIFDKPIWTTSTPEQKTILITLLGMANFKENEWEFKSQKFIVKSGQFITSLESIAEKSGRGITIQNVRTALKRFEKYGFLTNESTNKNRLITIVNWDFYQGDEDEPNKQPNKQLTSNQQATNKQLTTNKESNKEKEGEKEKNIKQEEEKANPFTFFESNGFGTISPFMADEISYWLDSGFFDEPEEIVVEAMKEALKAGAKRLNYITRCLKDWKDKNLRSLNDVQAHNKRYEASKQKKTVKGNGENGKNEDAKAWKQKYNIPF